MLTKPFFAISILLPLVAISATANAGSAITDKSYWPSAARPAVQSGAGGVQSRPRDAFASSNDVTRFEATSTVGRGENGRRYHGDPKSPW